MPENHLDNPLYEQGRRCYPNRCYDVRDAKQWLPTSKANNLDGTVGYVDDQSSEQEHSDGVVFPGRSPVSGRTTDK